MICFPGFLLSGLRGNLMNPTDVFLGPVCEYVISPVAKYAGVWNIPLLTAAAQADGFTHKQPNYPLLTRMMGSYRLYS